METSFYIEHYLNLTKAYAHDPDYGVICNFFINVVRETGRKDISCNISYKSFQDLVLNPAMGGLLFNYNVLEGTSYLFGVKLSIDYSFEDALVVLFDGVVSHNKLVFTND